MAAADGTDSEPIGAQHDDVACIRCSLSLCARRWRAPQSRCHRPVRSRREGDGGAIARGRAPRSRCVGNGRAQPRMEQHRARSRDRCGNRSNDARVLAPCSRAPPAWSPCSRPRACSARTCDLALCGGVESMSRVQIGLDAGPVRLDPPPRRRRAASASASTRSASFSWQDIRLHIPSVANRATGKSMGEHCEEMAKQWNIARADQDRIALQSTSARSTAQASGFFDDLVIPVEGMAKDGIPRADTSAEKLAKLQPGVRPHERARARSRRATPRRSPTAPPAIWVANDAGLARAAGAIAARAARRLGDRRRGHLPRRPADGAGLRDPAPARAQRPHATTTSTSGRSTRRSRRRCCATSRRSRARAFLRDKAGVDANLGQVSVGATQSATAAASRIGHPFGATGARILSQAVKELAAMARASARSCRICADGGLGTVALLESAGLIRPAS